MSGGPATRLSSPRLAALAARQAAAPAPGARCELCGEGVPDVHRHLLEVPAGRLLCSCRPCAVLFDRDGAAGGRVRPVPEQRRLLAGADVGDAWDGLGVPVGLAFFTRRSASGTVVAVYPSPAGPTESPVEAEAWAQLVGHVPVVAGLEPDVEALLVRRLGGVREAWLLPVDDCYRLVALFRTHWRGMSGGDEIWDEVSGFFAGLHRDALVVTPDGSRPAPQPAVTPPAQPAAR